MFSSRVVSLILILPLLYGTWFYFVNSFIREPYLDEFFHVPQAQAYCDGDFQRWDPKITTPPGIYYISYFLNLIKGTVIASSGCSVADLRLLSLVTASFVLPLQIFHLCQGVLETRGASHATEDVVHTVINISLFPLLFFFSGLYYTDICSISVVLAVYEAHLWAPHGCLHPLHVSALATFLMGLCALLMRQTNIFWVAVFLAGVGAVRQLKWDSRSTKRDGQLHDKPIEEAFIEDYLMTSISLAKEALQDPVSLLRSIWPQVALLVCFAIFVFLNGGVVLGDKTNHVASIHTPQMLYFWPYILFFSWPLMLSRLFQLVFEGRLKKQLPRLIVALPILATMILAVRLNTIVHPFTLADNRHYVFYVFKIFLKHPLVKYVVVPIYFFSAWAAITTLEGIASQALGGKQVKKPKPPRTFNGRIEVGEGDEPVRASFLLVFLAATALSVITAPLVEPRYFMLPWLIWRVHAGVPQVSGLGSRNQDYVSPESKFQILFKPKFWLSLETAWFLTVNLLTCYVFLYRGFEWDSEPSKTQRFLW